MIRLLPSTLHLTSLGTCRIISLQQDLSSLYSHSCMSLNFKLSNQEHRVSRLDAGFIYMAMHCELYSK